VSRFFCEGFVRHANLGLAVLTLGLGLRAAEPPPLPSAGREITALLDAQSAAWNRGDIDGFMQGYAQTDTLRFASGDSVTYGWKPTLEAYKRRYPDKAAMGKLEFSGLVITELAPDAAVVFGRWRLTRAQDAPHGLFTLTLKKSAAGWRIIFDHTSGGD
jgi:ketosteroid isomerase-like protein